jgi:hypothetical protein
LSTGRYWLNIFQQIKTFQITLAAGNFTISFGFNDEIFFSPGLKVLEYRPAHRIIFYNAFVQVFGLGLELRFQQGGNLCCRGAKFSDRWQNLAQADKADVN